ncbi:hypothetical protein GGTG_06622 [Gaeumannomyces tritici R3-111a-1]|uniref:Uncharacterized protein n=1 Tax=Gaeumannomyces tritici (strain R3-111a-1) TaxID=644352 RepID=J3NZC3_GAET3|nr:hypothetical protein GGTG_06622 [Gaeumannomyces tritici R3-111a-1]EJT76706.1 hypothetical protein GGTG_06622 [Gaeumannomyces tritici R3-111a-1]
MDAVVEQEQSATYEGELRQQNAEVTAQKEVKAEVKTDATAKKSASFPAGSKARADEVKAKADVSRSDKL